MKTNRNQSNVLAAFATALKAARANGNKLTQKEAANIALATIAKLFNDDGKPITITPQQRDELKMIFYPKSEYRMNVIKAILKVAGCTLDSTTGELLTGLLTPAQLEKKLAAAQAEAPTVDWSKLAQEEGPSLPADNQEDPASGEENADASEEEPPAAAPVKPSK